jgi:predicted exporter
MSWHGRLRQGHGTYWLLALFLAFCAAGIGQLHSQNDLRQWLGKDPALFAQSQRIVELTGQQPTSQFFLVRAADQAQLLQRQQALGARLDALVKTAQLRSYLSLNQLTTPAADLQALRGALADLPGHWQALLDLGIPAQALQAELQQLLEQPQPDLEQALASPLAEPWRALWLGRDDNGVAAVVSLQGQTDSSVLQGAAEGLEGVQLVDRLGELNRLFAATQISAAELKLISCLAIVLLLCIPFGIGGALRVVCLPLLAALAALACLGWLGQPLTLFSLFGLLLITAIGVDYAILMRENIGGPAVSLLGTLLSAISSWLSFGLLLLSQTRPSPTSAWRSASA